MKQNVTVEQILDLGDILQDAYHFIRIRDYILDLHMKAKANDERAIKVIESFDIVHKFCVLIVDQ